MVPVFETDLKDRENPSVDWKHYELWEKIEQRRRKAKRLWILATLFVSLCLLSVPTVIENRPKWRARALSRALALRIVRMKTDASNRRLPQQIVFSQDGSLSYKVETVQRCGGELLNSIEGYPETLGGASSDEFRLLNSEQGIALGIPGLVASFCYDPVEEAPGLKQDESVLGFGFITVKDLSDQRSDRVSIVLLRGKSAEISFN